MSANKGADMGLGIRATVAALLIALFYGLLGAVTWFGVATVHRAFTDPAYLGKDRVVVGLFGTVFVVPAVQVAIAAVKRRAPAYAGVELSPDAQPELWRFIETLAGACEVPAPTRIVVTAQVSAAAQSSAALFGTLRRERTVYLGLPLLAVLDTAQIAAVVCHELGHHAGGDSRLTALTYRSGDMLLAATIRRGKLRMLSLTQGLFQAFAGVYFSMTFALRRRQELAADRLAARVAGSEATATALEALPLITATYAVFAQSNRTRTSAGEPLDPAADLAGYRDFFESATLAAPDGPVRRRLFDSHPPMAERVAAVHGIGSPPTVSIPSGQAIDLLRMWAEVAAATAQVTRSARSR
ncbi:Zn-dependent protease with chaperone function [Catenulispora sp. MAP12-49]|uniref:M48 family metallopeptidase n=1 Tax=Catenulispora sp. MAP12-49 TaxID=3156302 RepID=UPI003515319C